MIVNSVMLKLKDEQNLQQVKELLLGMKGKIDVLIDIQVEHNIQKQGPSSYDLIFFTQFGSLEDMDTYIKHPIHIEAAKLLSEHIESLASVCYNQG